MTLSTSQLRSAWAPACKAKGAVLLAAFAALDAVLQRHRYAPRARDTGAYNCRRITGGTGYSLHAYGPGDRFRFWNGVTIATALAVDINWTTNPYGRRLVTDMPRAMIDDILAIRTVSGDQVWRWGGDYRTNKDAMHFEIVCTPTALATGIRQPATAESIAREWQPVRPGDSDASIARRGGLGTQVTEVQMILTRLARLWAAPELDPGGIDGEYGPRSQVAVRAYKARIRALQQSMGHAVWPNADEKIGKVTIGSLRWWNGVTGEGR
jgi:hypothetical protein